MTVLDSGISKYTEAFASQRAWLTGGEDTREPDAGIAAYTKQLAERQPMRGKYVPPEEVESFRREFPSLVAGKDDETIADLAAWRMNNPQGAWLAAPEQGFFRGGFNPLAQQAGMAAGGIRGLIVEPGAQIGRAFAALADLAGNPTIAQAFRDASDEAEENFEAGTLGKLARGTTGGDVGAFAGILAPSAAGVAIGSPAAAAIAAAYFGIQAMGEGAEDYRDTMEARGLEPDAVEAIVYGTGFGVIEYVAERLGLGAVTSIARKHALKIGDLVLRGELKGAAGAMTAVMEGATVNAVEEGLTQFSQNALAAGGVPGVDPFDPNRNPMSGVRRAAGMGAIGGGVLTIGGAFGQGRSAEEVAADEEVPEVGDEVEGAAATIDDLADLQGKDRIIAAKAIDAIIAEGTLTPEQTAKAEAMKAAVATAGAPVEAEAEQSPAYRLGVEHALAGRTTGKKTRAGVLRAAGIEAANNPEAAAEFDRGYLEITNARNTLRTQELRREIASKLEAGEPVPAYLNSMVNRRIADRITARFGNPERSDRSEALYWTLPDGRRIRSAQHAAVYARSSASYNINIGWSQGSQSRPGDLNILEYTDATLDEFLDRVEAEAQGAAQFRDTTEEKIDAPRADNILNRIDSYIAETKQWMKSVDPTAATVGRPKGARGGGAPIFRQVIGASLIASARVAKAGVKGLATIDATIRAVMKELKLTTTHFKAVKANVERILSHARTGDDEIGKIDPDRFDRAVAQFTKEETRKETEAAVGAETGAPAAADGRQAWEMTFAEVDEAVRPGTKEELQRARPILKELFPPHDKRISANEKDDPWGIYRAIVKGDELPRTPKVDLSIRHRAAIGRAIAEGKIIPPEVLADYPDQQFRDIIEETIAAPRADDILNRIDSFIAETKEWMKSVDPTAATVGRPKGARGGSAPIFRQVIGASLIASARVAKAGVKGLATLDATIRAVMKELKLARTHFRAVKANVERILSHARTGDDETGEIDAERFDRAVAAFTEEETRKETEAAGKDKAERTRQARDAIKQRIRAAIVGDAGTRTVSEGAALEGSLKRQQQTSRQAYMAGVRAIRETIPGIRAQMRAEAREDAAGVAAVKKAIVDAVRDSGVPAERQGKFLRDVERAKTPGAVQRAVNKIELIAQQERLGDIAARFRRTLRRAARLKSTNAFRDEMKQMRADGVLAGLLHPKTLKPQRGAFTSAKPGTKTRRTDVNDVIRHADKLQQVLETLGERVTDEEAAKRAFMADQMGTLDDHVQKLSHMIRVNGGYGGLPDDPTRQKNLDTGAVRTWWNRHQRIENILWQLDKGNGPASALLRRYRHALTALNTALRDRTRQLEALFRKAGYASMSEARMKMSGTLGEPNATMVTMNVGGREVQTVLDAPMHVAAMDPNTVALFHSLSGKSIQFREGQEREPIVLSPEDIEAAREQIGPKNRELVEGVKDIFEDMQNEVLRAMWELNGYEPERVDRYFPRRRNLKAGARAALAKTFRQATQHFLEDLGLTRDRADGGSTPIVLDGFLNAALQHLDGALKLIHLGGPFRDLWSVLRDPRIIQAINVNFGASMNEDIEVTLAWMSGANDVHTTKVDRRVRSLTRMTTIGWLSTNPESIARQVTGLFMLPSRMQMQDFLAGLATFAKPRMYQNMVDNAADLWVRYHGDTLGMISPLAPGSVDEMDPIAFAQGFKALGRAVAASARTAGKEHKGAIWKSWDYLLRTIKLREWADSIVARIAFAGSIHKFQRLHPKWDRAKALEAAGLEAAGIVADTQGSASPIDSSALANRWRGTLLGPFLMFTTPPLAALNATIEATRESKVAGAKAATGLILMAVASGLIVEELGEFFFSRLWGFDDDEDERLRGELARREFSRRGWRVLRELSGSVVFGDRLVQTMEAIKKPFMRDSLASVPLIEAFAEVGSGVADLFGAIESIPEGDLDKTIEKTLDAFGQLWESSAVIGNPLVSPIRTGGRIMAGDPVEVEKRKRRERSRR